MPDRPNVVFVLCDQLRAEAVGCLGNDQVATPAIDRLADEGVLCPRTYTPNPVCSPARASLQTGRYPHANGVPGNKLRLPTDGPSLAGVLRDAGYRTGYVGKWHLDGEPAPGYIPPGPRRQGYEYWEGFNRGHRHLKGHPTFDADGEVRWETGYQPAVQTDHAVEFVGDHQDTDPDRPFFLMLSWGPPHTPFEAPEEYAAMYDPEDLDLRPNVPTDMDTPDLRADLAAYYALITSLDDQLERLLGALEREGVAEDTLVVFTSDHGEMLGSLGRERKGYPFEESVHVPLVARYPGEIPAGHRADGLLNLVDLPPTLLSFCGEPVPDVVQGEDRAPVLRGDADGPDATFIEGMMGRNTAWRAVRTHQHLLVIDRALSVRYLFDTDADPYQTDNLAGDPAVGSVETDLYDRLVDWIYGSDDYDFALREQATRNHNVEVADDPRRALLEGPGDVFDDRGE